MTKIPPEIRTSAPETSAASPDRSGERDRSADPVVHYQFVDALRGLAFLMVLTVHAGIWADLKGTGLESTLANITGRGIFGVQLFFVISAFTLFQSMDARASKDRHPLKAFFARRFFRIAPLFWIAIVFYLFWYGLGPRSTAPEGLTPANIALTATFLHGWRPTTINSVVPGGWSIAVEMCFYLMLPILHRWFRSPGRMVCLLVAALMVVFLLDMKDVPGKLYPAWQASDPKLVMGFGHYWLPYQFPVFVLGLLLYCLHHAAKPGPGGTVLIDRRPLALSLMGLFLTLLFTAIGSQPKHLLFSTAFCLLAWSLSLFPTRLLVNRATCYLGKISFSAYLTHFAILDMTVRLLGMHAPTINAPSRFCERSIPEVFHAGSLPGPVRFALLMAIVLPLTALACTATYRLIEEPGVRLGKRLIRARGW